MGSHSEQIRIVGDEGAYRIIPVDSSWPLDVVQCATLADARSIAKLAGFRAQTNNECCRTIWYSQKVPWILIAGLLRTLPFFLVWQAITLDDTVVRVTNLVFAAVVHFVINPLINSFGFEWVCKRAGNLRNPLIPEDRAPTGKKA